MSWSVNVFGTAGEIGKEFDRIRDQAGSNGMLEAEQRDIDEARDFAMQLAGDHGNVNVSAWDSWMNFGPNDPRTGFSEATVSVKAPAPKTEPAP